MRLDRRQIHRKRDRLHQLRVFCHAAKMQSIGRAAGALGISQPAVSLQVRELEHELEALLFERNGPSIALTPAGERLYGMAAPLVETLDRLPDSLSRELAEPEEGEVRVAAIPSIASFVLPPFLKRFRDEYPGFRIRLRAASSAKGLERLVAGKADLMVGPQAPETDTPSVRFRPLFHSHPVLITALDHPLAGRESVDIREAAEFPSIVPRAGAASREFGEAIAYRFGVNIEIAIEVSGWAVIKEYVAAGLGISMVPSHCLTGKENLWRIPFGQYAGPLLCGLHTRRDAPLRPPVTRLVEILSRDPASFS